MSSKDEQLGPPSGNQGDCQKAERAGGPMIADRDESASSQSRDERLPLAGGSEPGRHCAPPIRAVMMTPSFELGGAQVWVRTMITEMDPLRVAWEGVVLAHPNAKIDDAMLRPIAARTRVTGPSAEGDEAPSASPIEWFPSRREAAQAVLRNAEIVVCWATGRILPELLAGFKGPVVAVSHGVCLGTRRDMKRHMMKGATHAAAVSSAAARACPRSHRARIILNGVDPIRCAARRCRASIRSEWGVDDDETILVGYVGRFAPGKNALAAALAVASLPDHFEAVLVGEGATTALTEETRQAAAEIGGARVRVIGPTEEVGDVYGAIDVLVMASSAEGCSLTLIEAWLAGVPVVATRVGHVPELEKKYGRLVYPLAGNPTSRQLANAVREAAEHGRAAEVPLRAQGVAREHLTARAMTDNWATYLEEIRSEPISAWRSIAKSENIG